MKTSLFTRCIHAGELADAPGPPHTSIYTTTRHGSPAEERSRGGISGAMLRLSIGLEDAADLNPAVG